MNYYYYDTAVFFFVFFKNFFSLGIGFTIVHYIWYGGHKVMIHFQALPYNYTFVAHCYKSMVRPVLEYVSPVLDAHTLLIKLKQHRVFVLMIFKAL